MHKEVRNKKGSAWAAEHQTAATGAERLRIRSAVRLLSLRFGATKKQRQDYFSLECRDLTARSSTVGRPAP